MRVEGDYVLIKQCSSCDLFVEWDDFGPLCPDCYSYPGSGWIRHTPKGADDAR